MVPVAHSHTNTHTRKMAQNTNLVNRQMNRTNEHNQRRPIETMNWNDGKRKIVFMFKSEKYMVVCHTERQADDAKRNELMDIISK